MIHRTAIVDRSAVIGDYVNIGPYTVIGKNVVIGDGTTIGSHVYIECADIGRLCRIYHSASIGADPHGFIDKNERSRVYIGKKTTVREFVVLDKGSDETEKTIIGEECYFFAHSHVGHDCRIGNGVAIVDYSAVAGFVEIEDDVRISSNVLVTEYTRIGRGASIGSNSTVRMNVIPYALCVGHVAVLEGVYLNGMERCQLSEDEISAVKGAYRTLFMSKLLLKDALEELKSSKSVAVQEIVTFIINSKKGITRPKRRKNEETNTVPTIM